MIEHICGCGKDSRSIHIGIPIGQRIHQLEIAQVGTASFWADDYAVLHPIALAHNGQGIGLLSRAFIGFFCDDRLLDGGLKGLRRCLYSGFQPLPVLFRIAFRCTACSRSPCGGFYPGGIVVGITFRQAGHFDQHIEINIAAGLNIIGFLAGSAAGVRRYVPDNFTRRADLAVSGEGCFQRLVFGCRASPGIDCQIGVIGTINYKSPARTVSRGNQAHILHALRQYVAHLIDWHRVAAGGVAHPDTIGRIVSRAKRGLVFHQIVGIGIEGDCVGFCILRNHVHTAVHRFEALGDRHSGLLHTRDGDFADGIRGLGVLRTADRGADIRSVRQVHGASRRCRIDCALRHRAFQDPCGGASLSHTDGREGDLAIFLGADYGLTVPGGTHQSHALGENIMEGELGVIRVFPIVAQRELIVDGIIALYCFCGGDFIAAIHIPVRLFRQGRTEDQVAADVIAAADPRAIADGKGSGDAVPLSCSQIDQRLPVSLHRHVVNRDPGKAAGFICGLFGLAGHCQCLAAVAKFVFHDRAVRSIHARQHKYFAGPRVVVNRRCGRAILVIGNSQRINDGISVFTVICCFPQV